MRFSLVLAIAPFSSAAISEKAFCMGASMEARKPSGKGMRLMSSETPSAASW